MDKPFDTAWTDNPVCPHCGDEEEDWSEYDGLRGDGSEIETDCGSCEKPFRITMSVSYSFFTEKPKVSP